MATPILPARVTNYTGTDEQLDAFDMNAIVVLTNGSAATLDIPDDDVVDFPIGTQITVIQGGAGAVTITADGSATVTGVGAAGVATVSAGDHARLVKTAANTWYCVVDT